MLAGPYTVLCLLIFFFYYERYQDWPALEPSISLMTIPFISRLPVFLSQVEME